MDGNDEIDSYYAGLVSMPKSQLNSSENRARSPPTIWPNSSETTADSFALRLCLEEDKFVDANTGLPLNEGLCRAARQKEIEYFVSKGVWELRPINEAGTKMGRGPHICPMG